MMLGNSGMEKRPPRFSLPEAFFEAPRIFLMKAKGVGEEVRGRLSGHAGIPKLPFPRMELLWEVPGRS
jgi:hypothetical protein